MFKVLSDAVNGDKSMDDVITVLRADYVGADKSGRDIGTNPSSRLCDSSSDIK